MCARGREGGVNKIREWNEQLRDKLTFAVMLL